MIPENIQFTYITGSFFGILRVRGFFELEIQRHGGYMYLQLELWGRRDLLEGTDKSVKAQMIDYTADYCGKQDTWQALIHRASVYIHLQKKASKIWVAHWAQEALKVDDFLVRKSFAMNADQPCLLAMCQQYIFYKEIPGGRFS